MGYTPVPRCTSWMLTQPVAATHGTASSAHSFLKPLPLCVFPAADGLPDSGLGSAPTDPPFRPNRSADNKGPNERDPTCSAQQRTSCARRLLCEGTSTPDHQRPVHSHSPASLSSPRIPAIINLACTAKIVRHRRAE